MGSSFSSSVLEEKEAQKLLLLQQENKKLEMKLCSELHRIDQESVETREENLRLLQQLSSNDKIDIDSTTLTKFTKRSILLQHLHAVSALLQTQFPGIVISASSEGLKFVSTCKETDKYVQCILSEMTTLHNLENSLFFVKETTIRFAEEKPLLKNISETT